MIFATTGTQLAFPRLMAALDALASGLGEPIVAQAGPDPAEAYPALTIHDHMTPEVYERTVEAARVIVAHAGIGTILTARRHRKPLLLVPRRHDLGEHRNDHQLATARQVEHLDGIHVVWDVVALGSLLTGTYLHPASENGPGGDDRARLTGFIRRWVDAGGRMEDAAASQ